MLAPWSAHADQTHVPRGDISIVYDGQFNRAHGVRSGNGTPSNPYVISGWTLGNISIQDTTKAFVIRDNVITGTLRLNWVGHDVMVMHNTVGDLRVNENNPRWGDPTSGHIMHNTFSSVSQIRHFDGMFSYNTVGAMNQTALGAAYPETRAVNFDGFHGARFDHNTIYGYVDARLHGHHHASAFGTTSHMHADGPHSMPVDHTRRYHEVLIQANRIYTSHVYALSYLDTDHAANDRTANSETNPYLNAPHTHYTRVNLLSNRLFGAGILVDVFNARDDIHRGTPKGTLDIAYNTISLQRDTTNPMQVLHGINVQQARYLTLKIRSNTISGPAPLADVAPLRSLLTSLTSRGTGVFLNTLDHATVLIDKARVYRRQFGVQATQLTRSVSWSITGLATADVVQPVSYDGSVANAPRRS